MFLEPEGLEWVDRPGREADNKLEKLNQAPSLVFTLYQKSNTQEFYKPLSSEIKAEKTLYIQVYLIYLWHTKQQPLSFHEGSVVKTTVEPWGTMTGCLQ